MEYIEYNFALKPNFNKENSSKKEQVKILMVEDNKIIQLIHKELLIQLGCQVTIAANGEEALHFIENHYDLILLDVGLPGIDGIGVAESFRHHKNHHETRMVILSATADRISKSEILCLNIEMVLNKPVSIKDLRQTVCFGLSE